MQVKIAPDMNLDSIKASAGEAADLLAVLANTNRLMILCHLLKGEMAVGPLADVVDMNQSALSQQLARLRALKLVETRRDGRTIFYKLASAEVARILETLYDIFCADDDEKSSQTSVDPVIRVLAE